MMIGLIDLMVILNWVVNAEESIKHSMTVYFNELTDSGAFNISYYMMNYSFDPMTTLYCYDYRYAI